jgi:uncharacterized coiled-coil DUF342 family protein
MRTRLLGVVLAVVVVCSAQAAADDTAKSLKSLNKQMGGVTDKIDKTLSQMDKTMASMDQVRRAQPAELGKKAPSFRKEVDKLSEALQDVRSEFVSLRGKGGDYFRRWDASNQTITDPELRKTAAARRNEVVEKHQKLTDEMVAYRESITDYLGGLSDLSKVLAGDPSMAQSKPVLDKMDALKAQFPEIRSGLKAARDKIQAFRVGMPES